MKSVLSTAQSHQASPTLSSVLFTVTMAILTFLLYSLSASLDGKRHSRRGAHEDDNKDNLVSISGRWLCWWWQWMLSGWCWEKDNKYGNTARERDQTPTKRVLCALLVVTAIVEAVLFSFWPLQTLLNWVTHCVLSPCDYGSLGTGTKLCMCLFQQTWLTRLALFHWPNVVREKLVRHRLCPLYSSLSLGRPMDSTSTFLALFFLL